ncbi:MAG: hypothetical protein F9K29_08885 [Hyphomicrobiaceae bacterium]|nr:MAG: hypothetical protein F9K29_08885 [Hyphomicrobiaceae bacterium]
MLGRLVLLLLQIVVGWFGTVTIMSYIKFGQFRLFIFALVAAIVVFLIGIISAQILKEVGTPSSHTLSWALVFALIAAALWTFGPQFLADIPWGRVRGEYAVLAGAILGYTIKR